MNKDDINYNSEPVYWCNSCMSLNIKSVDGIDYCDKRQKTKDQRPKTKDERLKTKD